MSLREKLKWVLYSYMFRLGLEPLFWLIYTVQGQLCQLTTLLLCQNLGFWHDGSCKVCHRRSLWIQNALCGDYALPSVFGYQRLRYFISVKFGRGDRWQILRVKLNSDIRTVLRGVHEFLYSDTSANEDDSLAETWFPVGFYRKSYNSFWMLPTI